MKGIPSEFEYVEVDRSSTPEDWEPGANSVLLARCRRCGRFTEDITVHIYGGPMPDRMPSEENRNIRFQHCIKEDFGRALEENIVAT